jgi:hypothetical protein
VQFHIALSDALTAGALNVAMKSLGFRLHYDVYAKARDDKGSAWQSENYASVDTLLSGRRSDAQDGCDRLAVSYPLATIDSAFIPKFAGLVASLAAALKGHLEYNGQVVSTEQIIDILSQHATALMQEWGEEPGSKELRVLIETNR